MNQPAIDVEQNRPAGTFALHARQATANGLAVIPVRDKRPIVLGFHKWRAPPKAQTIAKWASKFPDADLGIVTGALSGVTVVDIDRPDQLELALEHFGPTPLVVRTAKGWHLYYRFAGERCGTLPEPFIGDIKGQGGLVVAPPSSGKTFHRGSWADLPNLPEMLATTLKVPAAGAHMVRDGTRGKSLFRYCQLQAPHCDDLETLVDVARTFNGNCVSADGSQPFPMPDTDVVRAAGSAWKQQTEGRNWVGRAPSCGQVVVNETLVAPLLEADPKHAGDALLLLATLRAKHGARDSRGKPWKVVARAMAHKTLPWSEKKIDRARKVLVKAGLVVLVKRGGGGAGDAHQYRFRSRAPALVPKTGTYVTKHPAPREIRQIDENVHGRNFGHLTVA